MNNSTKIATQEEQWTDIILPNDKWYQLNLGEIIKYKDLLFLFVWRDFVSQFKQTILGPIWFIIQPIMQAITMYLVFHVMGNISTDGLPPILFYLSGNILWIYFSTTLTANANTFTANAGVFGKVYFPRLITPLSIVISSFFKFGIQLILFIILYAYYIFTPEVFVMTMKPVYELSIRPEIWVIIPLLILMAGYGFSLGLIFSSLTTKYRDFKFLLGFGVQLLMYGSSVVLPLSSIPTKYQIYMHYNPFVNIIEAFKYSTMGKGELDWGWLLYSFILLIIITIVSLILFKKTEKNFMDTV